MAQVKRLTRRQKVLLSRIRMGNQPGAAADPTDVAALEQRGLVNLTSEGWKCTDSRPPVENKHG